MSIPIPSNRLNLLNKLLYRGKKVKKPKKQIKF